VTTLLAIIRLEALFILGLLFPLLIQLFILYLASRGLWVFTQRFFGRWVWLALALVGVPVHELSHAVAFLLTGAGVRRVVLFAPRGLPEYGGATGVVVPARTPSAFSRIVSSVAPFFGCSLAAWLILRLLLPGFQAMGAVTPSISPDLMTNGSVEALSSGLANYWQGIGRALSQLQWLDWRTYLAIYLSASLGMGAAPSAEDLKIFFPTLAGILVVLIPVFALIWALGRPEAALATTQRALSIPLQAIGSALSYATAFTLIVLVVLLVLLPIWRLRR
jgi:hypothetical protein